MVRKERLTTTLQHYIDYPEKELDHDRHEIVNTACRLLDGYQVNGDFHFSSHRNLFALAVADRWLGTHQITEKKALLDILKLVSTQRDEASNSIVTLSDRVTRLAKKNLDRGKFFDPECEDQVVWRDSVMPYDQYALKHENFIRSKDTRRKARRWGATSALYDIRKKLKINHDNEAPFQIAVLSKSTKQMANEMFCLAYCLIDASSKKIVLPADYNRESKRVFEHEYAHSQSNGLRFGYQEFLFRGLDEALTESLTSSPRSYLEQCYTLDLIDIWVPNFRRTAINAYMGTPIAREKMLRSMIGRFSLVGMLAISRLEAVGPEYANYVEKSIYLPASQVVREITQRLILR